jgi:hypothetical protein
VGFFSKEAGKAIVISRLSPSALESNGSVVFCENAAMRRIRVVIAS